jgi:hypothetical protein
VKRFFGSLPFKALLFGITTEALLLILMYAMCEPCTVEGICLPSGPVCISEFVIHLPAVLIADKAKMSNALGTTIVYLINALIFSVIWYMPLLIWKMTRQSITDTKSPAP